MKIYLAVFGLLLLLNGAWSNFTLTILHTNDVHGRIQQMDEYDDNWCPLSYISNGKCFGGVARMKTKLDQLRKLYPNNVFLDAGDQFHGTLLYSIFRERVVSYFMNKLGYQAMGLGKHDLDIEMAGLARFLNNITFKVVSSNINTTGEPSIDGKIVKSTVLTAGGQKIGIVGYTTREIHQVTSPQEIGNLTFTNETAALQKQVDILKGQGVNKIIALAYAGYGADVRTALLVKGLDVIVGGRSNTFLYNGTPPSNDKPVGKYPTVVTQQNGDRVLVVQAYTLGKYLGFLQVTFDNNGVVQSWKGNPILLDNTTARDPGILKDTELWLRRLIPHRKSVIGRSAVFLESTRPKCRLQECNLGNLICDAMIYHNLDHPDTTYWSRATIAMYNSGAIRANITKGQVTLGQVIPVMPFNNTINIVELYGKHLREVLEHSVSEWNTSNPHGRFLQFSGIRVAYDISKPSGSRVVSAEVRCSECDVPKFGPLEPEKVYQVFVNSFMSKDGDDYTMISKNILHLHTSGYLDLNIVSEYIKKMSPVSTGIEGRIRFVKSGPVKPRPCVSGSDGLGSPWPMIFVTFVTFLAFQMP